MMRLRRVLPLVAVVVLTSCNGDDGVSSIDAAPSEETGDAEGTGPADEVTDAGAEPDSSPTEAETPTDASVGDETSDESLDDRSAADDDADPNDADVPIDEILAELEENGFCDPLDVEGPGDVGTTTAMHFVVDARPAPPCFGRQDDRLDQAWSDLEAVAPVDHLDDISLLAGYEACEGCDTLAFVTALDEAGSFFLMAIDVSAAEDDPDELSLTLLHELSHVFTQDPTTQLDAEASPSDCATYHNGNGCVRESSYLWSWMTMFWDPADLAALDQGEADQDAGEERCELGGDYTGSYGASSPEEDFAEVFAAYVFDVDFAGELDEKLAFFDEYDEFRQIRQRADELQLGGLPNTFERCR